MDHRPLPGGGAHLLFGVFATVREAQQFERDNRDVRGLIIPIFSVVDWEAQ